MAANLHYLPRLDRSRYVGFAAVHWSMRIVPETPGWLTPSFHQQFRELMLHACARENLFCPTYCLMPDHIHLLWLGIGADSDQIKAMKFLREYLNRLLAGRGLQTHQLAADSRPQLRGLWRLQHQAYDHVLTEEERKQGAFAKTCFYVLANPVRAELVQNERDWPFSGAILPGYPDLHPTNDGYWELFWKLYWKQREGSQPQPIVAANVNSQPISPPSATPIN